MKLTSFSNYCMRVLMVAAARSPDLTTIRDLSHSFDISDAHIVKCVHQLGTWGYLETVRGNKGGFRLALAPDKIRVGEVLRHSEDRFIIAECFDPSTNTCRLVDICRFRPALEKATEAFLAVLDGVTLADITSHGPAILAALDLPKPRLTPCFAT